MMTFIFDEGVAFCIEFRGRGSIFEVFWYPPSQPASQSTNQLGTQPGSRPVPRGNRASAIVFVGQNRRRRTGALRPRLLGLCYDIYF